MLARTRVWLYSSVCIHDSCECCAHPQDPDKLLAPLLPANKALALHVNKAGWVLSVDAHYLLLLVDTVARGRYQFLKASCSAAA